jgi:molybdate transport system substrate-binding protein
MKQGNGRQEYYFCKQEEVNKIYQSGMNPIIKIFFLFFFKKESLALILGLVMMAAQARAENASVAVAANFTQPAKEIAAAFAAKTGDSVSLSFGASGQFLAQIENGAPYDVFLSADADNAIKAEQGGLAVRGMRFTYATGHLVLWSANPGLVDPQGRVLGRGIFAHVAIADPALAPYGLAAEQYLKSAGLWRTIFPKLVMGKSIAQTYGFVKSGNADLGFVALSEVIGKADGSEWLVPDASHAPITQQAVILNNGANNRAAREFIQFLKGPEAQKVILKYGYN